MIRFSLKKQIHYLAYILFVLTFLSLSFETALKSGSASSYGDLFIPITDSFYWPRFIVFLLPSLILIVLSSLEKKQYERVLKGLFLFSAPIVASQNIDLFSAYAIIPCPNQPENFIQLYYIASIFNALIWLGIITIGMIWTFQKESK